MWSNDWELTLRLLVAILAGGAIGAALGDTPERVRRRGAQRPILLAAEQARDRDDGVRSLRQGEQRRPAHAGLAIGERRHHGLGGWGLLAGPEELDRHGALFGGGMSSQRHEGRNQLLCQARGDRAHA